MKKTILGLLAVAALLAGMLWLSYGDYQTRLQQQETYWQSHVTLSGKDYDVATKILNLSGKPLTGWQELGRMTQLQELNIKGTGIDLDTYDAIAKLVPACRILWSVPVQGRNISSDATTLTVKTLAPEDLRAIGYLTRLETVDATECDSYDALMQLHRLRPELELRYRLEVEHRLYDSDTTSLELENPRISQLERALKYLPELTYVNLTGTLPHHDAIVALQQQYPDVAIEWHFEAFGQEFSSLETFVSLKNLYLRTADPLDEFIPKFRSLSQLEVLDCGLPSQTLHELNQKYPATKIVWRVYLNGVPYRTDAKYFMPVKHRLPNIYSSLVDELRYCTDMEVVDCGHYGVDDVSFVSYMPNLKYLLLCQTAVRDMEPIGRCKNLEVLELFGCNTKDLWPLVNLTNLKDLNLCDSPCTERRGTTYAAYDYFPDVSPLSKLTWLDRLWVSNCRLNKQQRNHLMEQLPDTELVFFTYSATSCGWRHSPNYYAMRDIVQMIYFVH